MNTYSPAPFAKRCAALLYEGLIMLALTVAAVFAAMPISYVLQDQPHVQPWVLCAWFVGTWWWYCHLNWQKGQTLAMKVWHLRLHDAQGNTPKLGARLQRFGWAMVFLIAIPAASYWLLSQLSPLPPKPRFYLSLIWWCFPWLFAVFHPSKQFLYDVLAGTAVSLNSNN